MPCLRRCPTCFRDDQPPVPGGGNSHARVMLVGEGPGRQEWSMHRAFCGKTGAELDSTYLTLAGLSRSDVWVTNAFRCLWAEAKDAPPMEIVRPCAEMHLKAELEMVRPETVVLMGSISNQLIGRGNLDAVNGTGIPGEILGHRCKIFSTFHPARGLHQGSAMQSLLDAFRRLKLFLRGELGFAEDSIPNPAYYRLTTADEVDAVLAGREQDVLALDTESKKTWKGYKATIRYLGYCATFCLDPGEAYMVLVSDRPAWERLCWYLRRWRGKILAHNLPHDWAVMDSLGCTLDWGICEDTLELAYIDARVPKGLKPLSYQLLSSSARNFDDVVRPYGVRAAMEYFEIAAGMEWPEPEQEPTGELATKKCPKCKGSAVLSIGRGKKRKLFPCNCDNGYVTEPKMTRKQGIGQKINRMITDFVKADMEEFDPWERWSNWGDQVQPVIDKLGPPPLASVELVPVDELMAYAAADAHSALRVRPILRQRMVELRRSIRG